jgi:hypothetical protein
MTRSPEPANTDIAPGAAPDPSAVLAKAVLRAARHLQLSNAELAPVVGITESSLSRMAKGGYRPRPGSKEWEACVHFVRLFRSLDAFSGGDETAARGWLRTPNIGLAGLDPQDYRRPREELMRLGTVPLTAIRSIAGLLDVVAFLDSRRALV